MNNKFIKNTLIIIAMLIGLYFIIEGSAINGFMIIIISILFLAVGNFFNKQK